MNSIQPHNMRSVLTFIALLLLLSTRTGNAAPGTASPLRLTVSNLADKSRYCIFKGNNYVVHTFLLSNTMQEKVAIDRLQTACSCATATSEPGLPVVLEQGKSVKVTVRIPLDRLAAGPYEKKAWAYCSTQAGPLAELDATGSIPSWMKPLPIPTSATAPDFTLTDLTGKPFHLIAQRGKIIAMFLFCGCPECSEIAQRWNIKQQDHWSELKSSNYVCIIDYTGPPATIKAFLHSASIGSRQYTVLRDPHHIVGDLYHTDTCPRSFVIDKDGTIDYTNNHPDDRPYANRDVMVERTYDSLFAGDLLPK